MRSFAKIKPSREFSNLQYSNLIRHFGETHPMSPMGTTKYAVSTIFHELAQCTSDIDNSVAKRSDTGKTVVYCRTRHLAGKLFLYFIH